MVKIKICLALLFLAGCVPADRVSFNIGPSLFSKADPASAKSEKELAETWASLPGGLKAAEEASQAAWNKTMKDKLAKIMIDYGASKSLAYTLVVDWRLAYLKEKAGLIHSKAVKDPNLAALYSGETGGGGQAQGRGLAMGRNFYQGEFRNGEPYEGLYIWPDGASYIGEFAKGRRQGLGVLKSADGSRYEGEWDNDKRHGRGIAYDRRGGMEYKGFWAEDRQSAQKVVAKGREKSPATAQSALNAKIDALAAKYAVEAVGNMLIGGARETARMLKSTPGRSTVMTGDAVYVCGKQGLCPGRAIEEGSDKIKVRFASNECAYAPDGMNIGEFSYWIKDENPVAWIEATSVATKSDAQSDRFSCR